MDELIVQRRVVIGFGQKRLVLMAGPDLSRFSGFGGWKAGTLSLPPEVRKLFPAAVRRSLSPSPATENARAFLPKNSLAPPKGLSEFRARSIQAHDPFV